uniref:Uncharacterized protein n=1 Tax=Falco tinnunculus TaxID=100819 RepID=A0A8C4V3W6_FALTI
KSLCLPVGLRQARGMLQEAAMRNEAELTQKLGAINRELGARTHEVKALDQQLRAKTEEIKALDQKLEVKTEEIKALREQVLSARVSTEQGQYRADTAGGQTPRFWEEQLTCQKPREMRAVGFLLFIPPVLAASCSPAGPEGGGEMLSAGPDCHEKEFLSSRFLGGEEAR